jgi:CheY-like chemotaxis protein
MGKGRERLSDLWFRGCPESITLMGCPKRYDMEQDTTNEKLKILIAEDDKQVRVVYSIGLVDRVFDKCFIDNGSDVLRVHKEWRPDIVVLDIMLPGMTGYAVLKTIRQDMRDTTTTIVMATSLSRKDIIVPCLQLGIQGYLVKPFTHREVAGMILRYYQKVNPERAMATLAWFEQAKSKSLSF